MRIMHKRHNDEIGSKQSEIRRRKGPQQSILLGSHLAIVLHRGFPIFLVLLC